jgi:hypothetical protein
MVTKLSETLRPRLYEEFDTRDILDAVDALDAIRSAVVDRDLATPADGSARTSTTGSARWS